MIGGTRSVTAAAVARATPTATLDWRRACGVYAVAAAIYLIVAYNHVTWLDEHQAWLIVRESPSLADLFRNLRYEAHPPLWHLVLYLLKQVAPSIEAMRLLQGVIVLVSLGLIASASALPLWLRAAISLNYLVLFEYGVLSRPYGLAVLFLVATLLTWHRPIAWLFLALLAQVSFHVAGLAGALCLYRLVRGVDGRRGDAARGMAGVLISGALALWFMVPPADMISPLAMDGAPGRALRAWVMGGTVLFPLSPLGGWFLRDWTQELFPFGLLLTLVTPVLLWRMFAATDRLAAGLLAAMFLGCLCVGFALHPTFVRHSGVVGLMVIAITWLAAGHQQAGHQQPVPRLAAGFLVAQAGMGIVAAILALASPLSASHGAARWIKDRGYSDRPWAVYPGLLTIDLAALANVKPLNLARGCRETFQVWNYPANRPLSAPALAQAIEAAARSAGGEVYVMSPAALPEPLPIGWTVTDLDRGVSPDQARRMRLYVVAVAAQPGAPVGVAEAWPHCPHAPAAGNRAP